MLVSLSGAAEIESIRLKERNAMESADGNVYTGAQTSHTTNSGKANEEKQEREKATIAPLTRLEALEKTAVNHGSNNAPLSISPQYRGVDEGDEFAVAAPLSTPDHITDYR